MIRIAARHDYQSMLDIYMPYVKTTAVTFEYELPDIVEYTERIASFQKNYPCLIFEHNQEIIGFAYAHRLFEKSAYQWDVEATIYCKQTARGQGIGTTLMQCLLDVLKLQNVQNVYSLVTYPNPSSFALHQKLGFVQSGVYHQCGYKLNEWHDVVVFERILQKSQPPLTFLSFENLKFHQIAEVLSNYQTQ